MNSYTDKTIRLILSSFSNFRIGFIRGHAYLKDSDVGSLKALLNHCKNGSEIKNEFEKRFAGLIGSGSGVSFAAGRMAFFALMKVLGIGKGDEVILPGFTCSVMPNAVWRTGAMPVFSDIDTDTFGSDAKTIESKITERTKMIVVQHSFGIPCNIHPIIEVAKKHNIFVMEDCAIALDSSVDGTTVGNWGDAAMFSTDHSKPLNTIIGGFLYTKDVSLYEKIKDFELLLPELDELHQKRLFDQFVFERKYLIPSRYSKAVAVSYIKKAIKTAFPFKSSTFLDADGARESSTGKEYPYPAKMPVFLAGLGLRELERWESEKRRRKDILKQYLYLSENTAISDYLPKAYFDASFDIVPLRFAYIHPDALHHLKLMARYVDIDWIWFKEPVICCSKGLNDIGYSSGSCERSERIAGDIINWPCVMEEGWEPGLFEFFKTVLNN